jgi:alpha,alpha-trehalase
VCRSRSQPPYLTAAIQEVWPYVNDEAWLERAYRAAKAEYEGFWLVEPHRTESGLSRYHDTGGQGCITIPDTEHFRAIAESGWDNTPRFGDDITRVLPVDLNSQLYRYEVDLAQIAELLGQTDDAAEWRARAETRRALIDEYFWDEELGFYLDYDMQAGERLQDTPRCLSAYVTLWAGIASDEQASRLAEALPLFENEHGLATCEPGWDDGTQHNYPVGWAYSHWYVTHGLRVYGYHEDASRIALKWLRLLSGKQAETGVMFERYNVVEPDVPAAGRYEIQEGFGWTNGVFAALVARVIFGVEPDWLSGEMLWEASLPEAWEGQAAGITLPAYPWPGGSRVECGAPPEGCAVTLGGP